MVLKGPATSLYALSAMSCTLQILDDNNFLLGTANAYPRDYQYSISKDNVNAVLAIKDKFPCADSDYEKIKSWTIKFSQ
jgi:hypothetical protein